MKIQESVREAWRALPQSERHYLETLAKRSPNAGMRCRCKIILSLARGNTPTAISRVALHGISLIYSIANRFVEGGISGLLDRREHNGKSKRLTSEQLATLEELLSKGATAHGWVNELWTTKRVAEVMRRHFHKRYSPGLAWRILTEDLGWSAQKPVRQHNDNDPEEITRWLAVDYPKILPSGAKRSLPRICGRDWISIGTITTAYIRARGCTPVSKITAPHERISAIGAMTISPKHQHFGFSFHLLGDNLNFHGDSVAQFRSGSACQALQSDYLPLGHIRYSLRRASTRVSR